MKAKRTILLGARWKFVDFKRRFNNALFQFIAFTKSVSKICWLYINRGTSAFINGMLIEVSRS